MKKLLLLGKFYRGYIRDETLLMLIKKQNIEITDFKFIVFPDIDQEKTLMKRIVSRLQKLNYKLYLVLIYIYLFLNKNKYNHIFIFKWNEELLNVIRKIKSGRTKIHYDLFVSQYLYAENNGLDVNKWYKIECSMIKNCDHCYAETPLYRDYFQKKYNVTKSKIDIIPLYPSIEWITHPFNNSKNVDQLIVGFWGSVLKQHGIEKIFRVAELLRDHNDIIFRIVANKKIHRENYWYLKNIQFIDPIEDLGEFIDEIDTMHVSFGHLNQLQDAHLVLPSKAMEGMARGMVVIHIYDEKLEAMMRSHGYHPALLYFDGSVENLAEVISSLSKKRSLVEQISKNARELILEHYNISTSDYKLFL